MKKTIILTGIFLSLMILTPNIIISIESQDTGQNPSMSWNIIERGPTWIKYQNGTRQEFRLQSYNDLVNYQNETGNYKEINVNHLEISPTGNYELSDTPYIFRLDKTRRFMTIYPDRNTKNRYVEMYMPSSFVIGINPFWQTVPSLASAVGTICWSTPNFDINIRLCNSKLFFEYIMKTSTAAISGFNMTVIPFGMNFSELNFINILTDAKGTVRPLVVSYNETTHDMIMSFDVTGLTYPITVDPSLSFYAGEQDCHVRVSNAVYNTAWVATTGTLVNTTIGYFGQTDTYTIYRSFLPFDTSALPDDCIPTACDFGFVLLTAQNFMTNYLVVQNGQPDHPENPPVAGDYDKSFYSGDGGSVYMPPLTADYSTYSFLPFNATGLTWINKTGVTKLCFRGSDEIAGIAPVGSKRSTYYTANNVGTSVDPYLIITYETEAFTLTGENPVNNSVSLSMPTCNVTINHVFGYNFNYTLSENTTGSWVIQSSGNDVAGGSKSFNYVNATVAGIKYYWMVSAINGSYWTNATYCFTVFNYNTSVDPIIPYNQSVNPLNLVATGSSSLDNVSLYWRYSINNLSWNKSYENYTTGRDAYYSIGYRMAIGGADHQTFTIGDSSENQTFRLRTIAMYLKRVNTVTSFTVHVVDTNETGCPVDSPKLATSLAFAGLNIPTADFGWCLINFSQELYLNLSHTYCFYFTAVVPRTTPASYVYVGYDNLSSAYSGGCVYYNDIFSLDGYLPKPLDDYLFNIYGDWILWNNTGNPDVVFPWGWSFYYPYGNGFYEFYSRGTYENMNETYASVADARCFFNLSGVVFPFWLFIGSHVFSLPMLISFCMLFGVVGFLLFYMRRKKRKINKLFVHIV